LESWWLAGKSSTLRLDVERRRRLYREDMETTFLHREGSSGDGIEVIGDLARVLVAKI
jgi:hypothetical protein